jgi:hypothetical protein
MRETKKANPGLNCILVPDYNDTLPKYSINAIFIALEDNKIGKYVT